MVDVGKLLAAITETERKALAVPEHLRVESWTHPGSWVMHGVESRSEDEVALVRMTGRQAEAIAEHIATNDPAAVLRHCKSDREIVELYRLFRRAGSDDTADALGAVLRLRARAYGISVEEETTGE